VSDSATMCNKASNACEQEVMFVVQNLSEDIA
jgi:hypothetical protein